MVAAKIANFQKGGDRRSADFKGSIGPLKSAELLNVSRKSVQRAKKVVKSGDKKLIAAVESGEVTVSAAALHVAASITPTCARLLCPTC